MEARGRRSRVLLLAAVAACAACGLIYELVLLTLSVSLTGGGITQTSLIVAGYVAALGVGALLAKPFLAQAATVFVAVEILLGLIGGLSAVALYVTFSFYGTSTSVLVVATAVLGILVGAEVPLLMTLLQSGRSSVDGQSAGRVLANLNAADYAGALAGGLVWPLVLLPLAGQVRGAALTGMVNLVAAAVVAAFLLRSQMSRAARHGATAALLAAAAVLAILIVRSADIEITARQRLYADPVVAAERSDYQQIVVTERNGDVRLYLDGDLQFSSIDEHRYTETLVHPALAREPRRVLILGGGDGLATRDVLRYPSVRTVV
ncbi:MAG: spermidine synthase, partial [Actinomycetota bacterium]|nr:spermidine synthase [Actinomycetota bacterium]